MSFKTVMLDRSPRQLELGNVQAICTQEKERLRKSDNNIICNDMVTMMEEELNFRHSSSREETQLSDFLRTICRRRKKDNRLSISGPRENLEFLFLFWRDDTLLIQSTDSNLDFHSLSKPCMSIFNALFS
jgi:hypothetical protein